MASTAIVGCHTKAQAPQPDHEPVSQKIFAMTPVPSSIVPVSTLNKPKYLDSSLNSPLLKDTYRDCNKSKYASAVIAINGTHAEKLYGYNENEARVPASLMKLIPIYMAFEKIAAGEMSLDDTLTIDFNTWPLRNRKLKDKSSYKGIQIVGVTPKKPVTLRQALQITAVVSAADMAEVLKRNLSTSDEDYQKQAADLVAAIGMKNTTVINASGVDHPKQKSTASDIALGLYSMYTKHPDLCKQTFVKKVAYHGGDSYNDHLGTPDAVIGKTGTTNAAGCSMGVVFQDKETAFIVVTLGGVNGPSRNRHTRNLYEKGQELWLAKAYTQSVSPIDSAASKASALFLNNAFYSSAQSDHYNAIAFSSVNNPKLSF